MPEALRPGGVRIHYEVAGDGPPLVLAHGFGASLEMWAWQRPYLAAGRRLILWDARGHGGSSAPAHPAQYSMPELAADLRAVLEAAGAAGGCVIGGISFGGQIALQYAVDYPDATRALVLSDTTTRGARPDVEMTQIPAQFAHSPGLAGAYVGMQARADLTPQLPALTMPALVIYGDWDELIADKVHRLADGLPQRRMVRMTGCFHGTSAQRPKDWTDAVLQFLADVDAGEPVSGELTR
ncbi:MAG: alpha/beta fold hydrolase [Dehalococcoidia bacterium]|nr:alpha/beta fold hydrolase [Dehalococcoidia bacterium]